MMDSYCLSGVHILLHKTNSPEGDQHFDKPTVVALSLGEYRMVVLVNVFAY